MNYKEGKAVPIKTLDTFLKLGKGDQVHATIGDEQRLMVVKHRPVSEFEVYVVPIETETIPNAELIALRDFKGVTLRYRDPETHFTTDQKLDDAVVTRVPKTIKDKRKARRAMKKWLYHIVST